MARSRLRWLEDVSRVKVKVGRKRRILDENGRDHRAKHLVRKKGCYVHEGELLTSGVR